MVITDAITRLIPGVISSESLDSESFDDNLLDYPVYTKPAEYRGLKVPDVLMNGDHAKIAAWRKEKQIELGNLVAKAFDSNIRNAFAHSLYNVNVESRKIQTRTDLGVRTYTFEEFQKLFLYSVILMNKLQNYLEENHNEAAYIITHHHIDVRNRMCQTFERKADSFSQLSDRQHPIQDSRND